MTDVDERAEILDALAELLVAELELAAWGRLLVDVARDEDGTLRVTDAAVEEILDEPRVERAFASRHALGIMRAVAAAAEALSALLGVDPVEVGGATFVRLDRPDGTHGVAFLPGQVRAPTRSIDARRGELAAWLDQRRDELAEGFEIGRGADVRGDLEVGTLEIVVDGDVIASGKQRVLGTFVRSRRSWVWGAFNPSLGPRARARAAELLDALPDREPWEISTRGFTTDEATAWTLAAMVASHHGLDGVVRLDVGDDGFVLLGVSELRPA